MQCDEVQTWIPRDADAHRTRIGVNHNHITVNAARVAVRTYSKDRRMRFTNASDPAYVPNSVGGPHADSHRATEVHWAADGQMVRSAYTPRPDDDDWGQARTLIRAMMDDEQRDRLVHNIVAHVSDAV
jgi:catalase